MWKRSARTAFGTDVIVDLFIRRKQNYRLFSATAVSPNSYSRSIFSTWKRVWTLFFFASFYALYHTGIRTEWRRTYPDPNVTRTSETKVNLIRTIRTVGTLFSPSDSSRRIALCKVLCPQAVAFLRRLGYSYEVTGGFFCFLEYLLLKCCGPVFKFFCYGPSCANRPDACESRIFYLLFKCRGWSEDMFFDGGGVLLHVWWCCCC